MEKNACCKMHALKQQGLVRSKATFLVDMCVPLGPARTGLYAHQGRW